MEEKRRKLMLQNQDFFADLENMKSNPPPFPIPRRPTNALPSSPLTPPTRPDDASGSSPQTVPTPTASMAQQQQDRAKTPSPRVVSSDPREASFGTPRLTCRGWSISGFCDSYKNFQPVRRISALLPPSELQEALQNHDASGEPLIIEGWHKHPKWREGLVSMEWLLENVGNKEIHVRNVHSRKDTTMPLSQFVEVSRAQEVFNVPGESERLYWKDGECPIPWKEWLQEALPSNILPGCTDDLLRHLQPSEAVESLLCYLGIGDTYTPAHKDLCASSGHNLMCFSENDGSSFWFMTATASAPDAAEYFQKKLGQELDWETHVMTLEEFGQAPFTVYVAEQKVGDLVLVPSRSVHQVVNRGGLAMKTSWSRMTLENLKAAYRSELPTYRRVCRLEQYRVKTVLYRSMLYYAEELEAILASAAPKSPMEGDADTPTRSQSLRHSKAEELHSLIRLFDEVLAEEYHAGHQKLRHIPPHRMADQSQRIQPTPATASLAGKEPERASSSNLACDFCGADIFQSFFECATCHVSDQDDEVKLQVGDGLLVCPGCYVEGRTCDCEEMEPIQCRSFPDLLQDRNRATKAVYEVLPDGRSQITKKKLVKTFEDRHFANQLCIFEAACLLRENRIKMSNGTRKCRGQMRPPGPSHDIQSCEGIPCPPCHGMRCFTHLLGMGSHCAEALLIRYRTPDGEKVWHDVHKKNNENFRLKHPALYKLEGTNVRKRLFIAAESFPRCKPGHPAMQLGWYDWYDQDLQQQPKKKPTEPTRPPPLNLDDARHEATERADSPLTPLNSSFGSPGKMDDDVISLDDSEDDLDVSASSHTALNPQKRNRAYVEIRPSSSSRSVSAKGQSVNSDAGDAPRVRKPTILVDDPLSSPEPSPESMDDHVAESYGNQLVAALRNANNAEPIFSKNLRQTKGGTRRTVIDPDGDGPSRHSSSSIVRASVTVPLSQKPAATEDTDTSMAAPPLPRFPRAAKKTLQLQPRDEDDAPPTPAAVGTSTRSASKKRKSTGPPGLRELPSSSVSKRTEVSTWKKPRLAKPLNDGLDNDEIVKIPTQASTSARNTLASKSSSEVPMDTAPDVVASPALTQVIRSSLTSTAPRRAAPVPNTAGSAASKVVVSTANKASVPASPKAVAPPVVTPPANTAMPALPLRALPPPMLPIPGTSTNQTTSVPAIAEPSPMQLAAPSVADAARVLMSALTAEMPLQSAATQALEKTSQELEETKQELSDLRGQVQVLSKENEELEGLREQMQVLQKQNEELVVLREQVAVLTKKTEEQDKRIGKNEELEQKFKTIAIGYEKIEEDLKKERVERGIVAKLVRQLEERVSRCDAAHSPEAVKLIVDHYCKESAERSVQESMQNTPKEDLERFCRESAERHCERVGGRHAQKWLADFMPDLTHAVRELSHMAVETYLKETLIYQEMTTRVTAGPAAAAANLLNTRVQPLYPGASPAPPSGSGAPRPPSEKHISDSGDSRRHSRQYGSQSSSSKHQQWSSQHRLSSGSQSAVDVGRPAKDLASASAAGGSRDEGRTRRHHRDRSPSAYSDRHRRERDRSYDGDERRRRGRSRSRSRSRSHNGSDTRRRRSRSRSPERRHRRGHGTRDHRGSDESDELADQALSYPDPDVTPEESRAREERPSRSADRAGKGKGRAQSRKSSSRAILPIRQ